ncbi:hypothetical protein BpHYR1_044081 [Brachionus plicatilis]|uniref:Uncharacterized protein n=1 Tax=Brachionus plicatilis TaxID=10195 RepID=A0A3M7QPC9_BRAPC|nr:hypothetical protein BpHYR1_044081 [Brachionus plicatilis]
MIKSEKSLSKEEKSGDNDLYMEFFVSNNDFDFFPKSLKIEKFIKLISLEISIAIGENLV